MRTIESRTYTNVALTVLILLFLALVIRPYFTLPKAYATDFGDESDFRSKSVPLSGIVDANKGLSEIAGSNKEIAAAIRETAQAQQAVAKAIAQLGASAAK